MNDPGTTQDSFVLLYTTDGKDREFAPRQTRTVIGRAEECALCFPFNAEISRLHATLNRTGEGWLLEDMNSRSGTSVNGEPLQNPRLLRDKDRIKIGTVELTVRQKRHDRETVDVESLEKLTGSIPIDQQLDLSSASAVSEVKESAESSAPHAGRPNWYTLIGVKDFENDVTLIQRRAKERIAELRQGERSSAQQDEIEQISRAVTCLLDPDTKREFDISLAQHRGIDYEIRGDTVTPAPEMNLPQFLFGAVLIAAAAAIIWFLFQFLRQLIPELLNRMTP